MKKDIALILGGGGGKGAYQIGVWQALMDYGIDNRVGGVAGTSVGALNAALFLGGNYESAKQVWDMVDNDKILLLDKSRHIQALKKFKLGRIFSDGVFSNQGLLDLLNTYADLEKISKAKIPALVTCCPVPEFSFKNFDLPKPVYFRLNGLSRKQIISVLLASSAIPFVFDAVEINGNYYVDGGLVDNLPIQPLYDLGFRKFIVINLDNYQRLPREKFRDADLIEIVPDYSISESISGILDFSPEVIQGRIQEGYSQGRLALSSRFSLPLGRRISKKIRGLLSGKSS